MFSGLLRFLIGYAAALLVLSWVDVAIMVRRFGSNADLSWLETLLLPVSGLRLSWPVHAVVVVMGALWVMAVSRLRVGQLIRAVAVTLPLAVAFAAALHFSARLPFFRGMSITPLLRCAPVLGFLGLPAAAAGMVWLSRGGGFRRRAVLALPIVLGLAGFAAGACISYSVAIRVPATIFVVVTFAALMTWVLPPRLEQRRSVMVTAGVLVLALGLTSSIAAANEDHRIRSDAAIAYRTYVMQALLFTKLTAFQPTLPQATCGNAGASRPELPPDGSERRRNVLFLTVDAARADHLAAYGYDRVTMPRVEALARESLLFETAYSPSPATQGSMVALWSSVGIPTLREASVWPPTLHGILREQGYATFATSLPDDIGALVPGLRQPDSFDRTVPMEQRAPELVANLLQFIDEAGDKPWIASAHFFEPHDSVTYSTLPKVFAERPWSRYDDALYFVDAHIGSLLDGLRERGMLDNTVVIVSADHGEFFGEHGRLHHGSLLYEPVMRVPLVVHVPGRQAARIPWPVSGFDIAPTALRAATGHRWPLKTLGRDLLGMLDGAEPEPERRWVFMENVSSVRGVRRHVAVRHGQWKYLGFLGTDIEQLFDVAADPGELNNLAGKLPHVRDEMRGLLTEVLTERSCVRDQLRSLPLARAVSVDTRVKLQKRALQ